MNRNESYERKVRLGELLKEILAESLVQLDEPDLELVSITKVDVDNNLNHAEVSVTSLDTDSKSEERIIGALVRNLNSFRQDIARQAHIRQLPELSFCIDESLKASDKIEKILQDLEIKEDGES